MDTYTDAWMLKIAFYNGNESILQKCMNNYYYGYTDGQTDTASGSMIAYLNGVEGYQRFSYVRYWHGYLIFLKPLLYFFDYGDIMVILKFVQLILIAFCIVMLERAKLAGCIPALVVMLGCIEFHVIGMSMQFSWVFMIAMVSSIYLLNMKEETLNTSSIDMVFLVTGMCTSYFDFLTYPLFTLGIPLTIIILRRSNSGWKGNLCALTLLDSLYWVLGYGGMWAMKWILGTVLTGENMIADGINAVLQRAGTHAMGMKVGYLEVLSENTWRLGKYPYVMAVVCVSVFLLLRKGHFVKTERETTIALFFVMCLPFLWYAISRNHSYIHAFMTYRNLGIFIFAWLCFLAQVKSE